MPNFSRSLDTLPSTTPSSTVLPARKLSIRARTVLSEVPTVSALCLLTEEIVDIAAASWSYDIPVVLATDATFFIAVAISSIDVAVVAPIAAILSTNNSS